MSSKAVKYLLAFAILGVLIYLVDLRNLISVFREITVESLVYLLLLSVALIYVSAVKWSLFVEALGERVSVFSLCKLYCVGYFVNLLLPSFIGGDVARSFYVGKRIGQHESAAATILERYTGLVAMVTLGCVLMWFSPLVSWQVRCAVGFVAVGLGIVTVCALSPRSIQYASKIPGIHPLVTSLNKIQAALNLARREKRLLAHALLLSFLFHTLTVINTLICAYAVGWNTAPVGDLFVVLPLILLVGALPIAPGGLGLQEGAFVFFLTGVGATPAHALGIGLILRAKSYLLALVGWLFWLTLKHDRPPTETYSGALH